jgi:hypothetical protein
VVGWSLICTDRGLRLLSGSLSLARTFSGARRVPAATSNVSSTATGRSLIDCTDTVTVASDVSPARSAIV